MSPANQIVVSKRHVIWVAIAAFGGMITAMLATLAITVPVMSAQASSQLDQQAKQFAQIMSAQAQTNTAKTAGAGFDMGLTPPVCVETDQGGGAGGAGAGAVAVAGVSHAEPKKEVKAVSHKAPAKVVSEKKVINNNFNTVNDNDVYAVNSFNSTVNSVEVTTKGKNNKVDVNLESKQSFKTDVNVNQGKSDHKGSKDHKKQTDHKDQKDHKKHDRRKAYEQKHNAKDDHKNYHKDQKEDHKNGSQEQ